MLSINKFLDTDYKEYAKEVVFKRAIPFLTDNFKDSGRKIFYYLKHNQNKNIKVSAIAGGIIEKCDYQHSETSAQNTIVELSKFYAGSNNLPVAIPEGHFGSKINKGSASARYIFASYNKLMNYVFLDDELTERSEDLESPEPKYFLPIIPMNVVNGTTGIAIGFSVSILPHNPLDVIDYMLNVLQKKKTKNLTPFFWGCDYNYKKIDDLTFEISSNGLSFQKDKIIITELKPEMDREKFIEILIDWQEKELIKSFKDETKDQFKFIIKNNKLTQEDIEKELSTKFHQNINVIYDDTVLTYKSVEEYISNFTFKRLSFYSKRKDYMKHHYNYLKSLNKALCCLIDNKKVLFKSKKEINDFFLNKGIDKDILNLSLSKPITSLNQDSKSKLLKEIEFYDEQIKFYDKIEEIKLYIKDLKILRKEIIKFYGKFNII